jgi:hypothetical protein
MVCPVTGETSGEERGSGKDLLWLKRRYWKILPINPREMEMMFEIFCYLFKDSVSKYFYSNIKTTCHLSYIIYRCNSGYYMINIINGYNYFPLNLYTIYKFA